jgi:hypothetical protein
MVGYTSQEHKLATSAEMSASSVPCTAPAAIDREAHESGENEYEREHGAGSISRERNALDSVFSIAM